jgi:hypothetical protein
MARPETGLRADQRFLQETVESLRRIAARLPAVLDQEVLRVAQELEENATRLKEAG